MSTHLSPERHARHLRAGWHTAGRRAGLLCAVWLLMRAPLAAEAPPLPPAAPPAQATATADSRADIARRERALKAQFDAEERACLQRFVVTSCVDDVRTRRRAELAPLRDAELRLDEAARRQQAEQRRAAVAQKQRALAERGPEPPPAPAASAASPQARSPWRVPSGNARPPDDAAAAAQRAEASRRRQAQGEAAQQRIARRQAEQAKKGQAAAPLPTPPQPSGASAAQR